MEMHSGLIIRSIILSFIMAVSCQAFFETVTPWRKMRYRWMEYTAVVAFMAGFMIIAVTEIPPYILQPVRVVAVIFVVAQIYFQISVVRNLILSVVYCGIYWVLSALFLAIISVTPILSYKYTVDLMEPVLDSGYLCLMMIFRSRYQKRIRGMADMKWGKFGFFSLAGIMVSTALTAWAVPSEGGQEYYYTRLAAVAGVVMIYAVGFYYMTRLMEKDSQMQKLRMLQEQTQNRMNLYQGMKDRYEQLRRYEHDYRNQLNCIQGMIGNGQTKEAVEYIAGLTGKFQQNEMYVNTNHNVVNVMLNQKYLEARDKTIVITMDANDLSDLTISEEDIVTLLGNLLDNAIEACEKLEQDRVIRFKMILEEEQLVVSIRNPVKDPVQIRNNRIVTNKSDKSRHGIGLLNVDSVVRKNHGTYVLKCEDGWFSFSAVIPAPFFDV